MVQAVRAHCEQAEIEASDLSVHLTYLTGQIHINGYKWKQGSPCRYRLPTDITADLNALRRRTIPGLPIIHWRIGILDYCVVVPTDQGEIIMACVIESHLFNTINGLDVVDLDHASPRTSLFHLSHINSLVMFADYWEPRARHFKVVLHVSKTRQSCFYF